MEFYRFTAEDLAMNKKGFMSFSQKKRFLPEIILFLLGAPTMIIVLISSILQNAPWPIIIGFSLLVVFTTYFLIIHLLDFFTGRVESVEGALKVTYKYQKVPTYVVLNNAVSFDLRYHTMSGRGGIPPIEEQKLYRTFYTKYGHYIVSIEPL